MKVEHIALELSKDNIVELGVDGTTIDKSIRCIIGGIPVYDIKVSTYDGFVSNTVKDFEELYERATFNEIGGVHKCSMCEEIIDKVYYINNEHKMYFCCWNCLVKFMDETFGTGQWKMEDDTDFMVKVSEEEALALDDVVKIGGEWWRNIDIMYVNSDFNFAEEVSIQEFLETDE
ncbi:MAG: hypothetical protein HDR05_12590 [Lachnospiraceae bacterium]|nr:hypothetical protein [Lachnospiraceae bacterium]